MAHIDQLEQELMELATQDKKTWVQFYKLIKQVEEQELWKEAEKRSFTAWVKDFSSKSKVHESVLWNRLKAGKVYATYERVQAQKGVTVAPIEDIDVTADSLVLLDKISKKNEEIGAELTKKVLNKELSRQDLRDTYKLLGGDQRPSAKKKREEAGEVEVSEEKRVTAAAIVSALGTPSWLGEHEAKRKPFKTAFEQDKYRVFAEFPVFTGTTIKSRRIDALVVENLLNDGYGVNIHGIEIKVSKSDLINDKKYLEYGEFVDYLWLATPPELIEVALEHKSEKCGVLVFEQDQVTIHTHSAKEEMPLSREQTLTNIILKTI